ncbi:hypothetical protein [Pelosinus baikalensis]|jgi:hypothetical protein|uniref:Uncharacterized protein n=1 Tax=Pelosinus baikalensis TaxID=2892015 RepID=A0ABS8HNA9_9FIRM|nr:hypothetical protein [Pelosinus baikalensis]MCC5463778.1 hypothetical protein [Pelosinus baikalensis]
MGKQINFLMDKETEEKFFEFVRKDGVVLFEGDNELPQIIDALPEPFSGKGWFSVYIYNEKFGQYIISETKKGIKYIDSIKSPVIEFNRTIVREGTKEVSRGRLWVETKFYNDNGEEILKDSGLDEWYKYLCKWIRKNVPKLEISNNGREYKEYISKSVTQLLEQGYKIV